MVSFSANSTLCEFFLVPKIALIGDLVYNNYEKLHQTQLGLVASIVRALVRTPALSGLSTPGLLMTRSLGSYLPASAAFLLAFSHWPVNIGQLVAK